jgi:hypothetical protein
MKQRLTHVISAVAFLVVGTMAILWSKDVMSYVERGTDDPPTVEFSWTPVGPVDLMEMKGLVRVTDDHGIDFTTYRFRIVELDRTLDLPIEGLVGSEYEQPISLSLIANNAILLQKKEVTIEIVVADDVGQETSIVKVIKLK